jgi:hypothetical protein
MSNSKSNEKIKPMKTEFQLSEGVKLKVLPKELSVVIDDGTTRKIGLLTGEDLNEFLQTVRRVL